MVLSDDGSFLKPVNLAVGLNGVALYGSIMTGSHADKEPRTNTTDQADLVNFFRDVVALPEQAPVAPAP